MSLPVLAVETDPAGRRGLWWRTGGPLPFLRARDGGGRSSGCSTGAASTRPAPWRRRRSTCRRCSPGSSTAPPRTATPSPPPAPRRGTSTHGRPADAAAVLAEALRRDSTHPLLLRQCGAGRRVARPASPALALYRRLAVDPTPVGVLVRQGELLIRMHRLPEAVRFVDSLPGRDGPRRRPAPGRRGRRAARAGCPAAAGRRRRPVRDRGGLAPVAVVAHRRPACRSCGGGCAAATRRSSPGGRRCPSRSCWARWRRRRRGAHRAAGRAAAPGTGQAGRGAGRRAGRRRRPERGRRHRRTRRSSGSSPCG